MLQFVGMLVMDHLQLSQILVLDVWLKEYSTTKIYLQDIKISKINLNKVCD